MMKIKFIKAYKEYKKGETISVGNNVAFGLIDSGVAVSAINVKESFKKTRLGETKAFEKAPSRRKV